LYVAREIVVILQGLLVVCLSCGDVETGLGVDFQFLLLFFFGMLSSQNQMFLLQVLTRARGRAPITRTSSIQKFSVRSFATSPTIWCLLLDNTGNNYKSSRVSQVPSGSNVGQFKKEVKNEFSQMLNSIDAAQLDVFENKASLVTKEAPLEPDASVSGLGTSKDSPVIISSGEFVFLSC
jgi:hypothetical protein